MEPTSEPVARTIQSAEDTAPLIDINTLHFFDAGLEILAGLDEAFRPNFAAELAHCWAVVGRGAFSPPFFISDEEPASEEPAPAPPAPAKPVGKWPIVRRGATEPT